MGSRRTPAFSIALVLFSLTHCLHGAQVSDVAPSRIRWETLWQSYLQTSIHQVQDSVFNPGNAVAGLPSERVGVDLRPEISATAENSFKAVVRPRARLFYWHGQGVNDPSFTRFHFDEASLRWNAAENLELLAGIHYVQWGPAELFSPSNPLIHFSLDQRSVTFRMRGKALVEADAYFGPKTFASVLVEPLSNGEPDWIYGHAFTPRGLARLEKQMGDNPGNYWGVAAGRMERGTLFASLYSNQYLTDLWSGYFDARITPGSPTLYPSTNSSTGVTELPTNRGPWNGLATVGIRYEGFFDTRVEYIVNTYGYHSREWADALLLARANPAAAGSVLGSASGSATGTELPRQHYLYGSLRTDRLGSNDSLRLSLRYLHSLSDHSGALFSAVEWSLGSHCTLILEPMVTHGGEQDELSQSARWELFGSLGVAL